MKVKEKINSLVEIGVKTALGFIPSPVSACFNAVYDDVKNNVLLNRLEKWKDDIVSRLEKVENDYQDLISNESFATTLIKTSELAVKTGSDEKRQLLANALINTYVHKIDEEKMIIFLSLIEKYTLLHIEIIKYLHDEYMKERFPNNNSISFMSLFRYKFSAVDNAYLEKTVFDLQNDSLVSKFREDAKVEFCRKRFKLLTKLGDDFYDYLKSNAE